MRRALIIAVAITAVLGMACGGGDGGDDAAADGDAATGEAAAAGDDLEQAFLEFAQCMRDHGVDMPDPETGDGGIIAVEPVGPGEVTEAERRQRAEAEEACNHLLPEMPPPSEDEATDLQDEFLAFTECMREHGVDMPDPQFEGGGGFSVEIGGEDGGSGPEVSDRDFEKAQEACEDLLPNFGAPGGGDS